MRFHSLKNSICPFTNIPLGRWCAYNYEYIPRGNRMYSRAIFCHESCSKETGTLKKRKAKFYDFRDPVPYLSAWRAQKYFFDQRVNNDANEIDDLSENNTHKNSQEDVIFLLEHPSVYTLGKAATLENLNFDPKNTYHELYRVERGGQVTWHGPGQLVMYPILNLTYHKTDVKVYIETLEEVIIRVLKRYNIIGVRQEKFTGVWVDISDRKDLILNKNIQMPPSNIEGNSDDENNIVLSEPLMAKVAAVGVSTSKWITMHGIAINVDPDLKCFDEIIPCGLLNKPVTSMKELLDGTEIKPPSTNQVRQDMQEEFAFLFDYLDLNILRQATLPHLPIGADNKDPEPVFK